MNLGAQLWTRMWRLLAFCILENTSMKEAFGDGRRVSTSKKLKKVKEVRCEIGKQKIVRRSR